MITPTSTSLEPVPGFVAVLDWRSGRELWRTDAPTGSYAHALGDRLAVKTDADVRWFDLRSGTPHPPSPLPGSSQVMPLTDGSGLAFLTQPPPTADQTTSSEKPTIGVLDPDGSTRWQTPLAPDAASFSLLMLGVEGQMVFATRSQDWTVTMVQAATATGEPVTIPDGAAPPMPVPGTDRMVFATGGPDGATHVTDLAGRELTRVEGGPAGFTRHGSLVVVTNDGSVPLFPIGSPFHDGSTAPVRLVDLRSPESPGLTLGDAMVVGLCGGVVYTILDSGDRQRAAYGIRAYSPDGTQLWDDEPGWSFPSAALCDGTRMLFQGQDESGVTLVAYTRAGRVWDLPELFAPEGFGRAVPLDGVGLLASSRGSQPPRILGQR